MDALALVLVLAVGAFLWALLAPVGRPDTPSADDLAERQAQIDRANNTEYL